MGGIGSLIGLAAAPFTGGASLLGSLGSFLGPAASIFSAISGAQSLFGGNRSERQAPVQAAQATPFRPSRPDAVNAPESLNEMAAFSPEQQRSALATRGLNQGLGADENSYYRNLVQRSLIGDGNSVDTSNPNFLMPIESQYFSQQGMNTSDIMQFLEGLNR
jgi:hypothetical protein